VDAPARPGGELLVDLRLSEARVSSVRLVSRRPAEASRVLEGQPVERALAAAPLLWSICSTAHSVAALSAVEAALGLALPAPQQRVREALALAEAIDNHAWQLCLEWPRLAGLQPDPAALKAVRALTAGLQAALVGKARWRVLGGVALHPDEGAVLQAAEALEARLGALAGPALPASLDGLRGWGAAGHAAAVLVARALSQSITQNRKGSVQLLPSLDPGWFLARRDEPLLSRAPLFGGAPAETGALARRKHHPLVAEALRTHGPGTLARLLARLVEVAALPAQLRALAQGLAPAEPAAGGPALLASGSGAGVVETSRGALAHVVTVEQGVVARWRTVAPTEWNFHPEGPLVLELRGLPTEGLAARAALAVTALDPCVGYDVQIQ
jgi:coenzyme F420-reducing hydrogenase alpha subunit